MRSLHALAKVEDRFATYPVILQSGICTLSGRLGILVNNAAHRRDSTASRTSVPRNARDDAHQRLQHILSCKAAAPRMTITQQVGCVPRAEQSQQGPVWSRQWHRVRSTHGVRYGGYIQAEDTEWQRFDASGLRDGTGVFWKELVSGRMSPLRCLTLGLAEIEPGKILPAHSHEPEEVYHVLESEGRCTIESVSYELRAGDTLFIPGGAVHQKESTGEKPLRFLFSFPVDQISDVAYHFA